MTLVIAGEDYVDILVQQTTVELVFSVGGNRRRRLAPGEEMECVNISIVSDSFVENDELFMVVLETGDLDVTLSPVTANVTITNNDS